MVDIDNNTIESNVKHALIPIREKRKLITRLELYAGGIYSDIKSKKLSGVPETIKTAYIDGSFCLKTCEPIAMHRKIQDIPKRMYKKYTNNFLQIISGVENKFPVSETNSTSSNTGNSNQASINTKASSIASVSTRTPTQETASDYMFEPAITNVDVSSIFLPSNSACRSEGSSQDEDEDEVLPSINNQSMESVDSGLNHLDNEDKDDEHEVDGEVPVKLPVLTINTSSIDRSISSKTSESVLIP